MKLRDWLDRRTSRPGRDTVPHGYVPRSVRTTGITVTSLIAIGTAIVSYSHGLDVVREVGNRNWIAFLIPLFADGLIFLCSIALFAAATTGAPCGWAWAGLLLGVGVTVTMNVTAGWPGGIGGALVGALTPAVLFIALKVLEWLLRLQVAPTAVNCPHSLPRTVADAAALDFLHSRDCLGEGPTYSDIAARWGVDRRKLPELVAAMSQELAGPPELAEGERERVMIGAGA
jgi:hypothetical protein